MTPKYCCIRRLDSIRSFWIWCEKSWQRLDIFKLTFGQLCSPDFRFFGLIICKKSWIFRIRRQKVRIGPPSWWKTTLKWLAKRYFLEDVIVELCQREKLVRHHRKPLEPNFHPDSLPHSQLKRAAISKFRPWLSIEYRFFRSETRVKNNHLNEINEVLEYHGDQKTFLHACPPLSLLRPDLSENVS